MLLYIVLLGDKPVKWVTNLLDWHNYGSKRTCISLLIIYAILYGCYCVWHGTVVIVLRVQVPGDQWLCQWVEQCTNVLIDISTKDRHAQRYYSLFRTSVLYSWHVRSRQREFPGTNSNFQTYHKRLHSWHRPDSKAITHILSKMTWLDLTSKNRVSLTESNPNPNANALYAMGFNLRVFLSLQGFSFIWSSVRTEKVWSFVRTCSTNTHVWISITVKCWSPPVLLFHK